MPNDLFNPKHDMEKWLGEEGIRRLNPVNPHFWTREHPTAEEIDAKFFELSQLPESVKTMVIIYQSGHGFHVKDMQGIGLAQK